MESLSIQCTTCGTRLRVRDPRLVGQIVACPKCQGMVLVEGTQGFAVGQGDVDSEALTQDKIDAGAIASDATGTPSPLGETKGWQADLPFSSPLPEAEGLGQNAQIPLDDPKSVAVSGAVPPVASESVGQVPPSPNDVTPIGFQSESSAKIRQYAAVAVVGLLGLIVAAATFLFVIRQWSNHKNSQAQGSAGSGEPVAAEGPDQSSTTQDGPADGSTSDSIVNDSSVTNATTGGTNETATETGSGKAEQVTTGDAETGETQTPVNAETDVQSSGGNTIVGSVVGEDSARPSTPDPLFPEVVIGGGVDANPNDAETTAEKLPPSLAQYMRVIEELQPAAALPKNTEPAPPAIDQLKIQFPQMMVADTEYPPPAPPINARDRGAMSIIGFIADQQPLDQTLRLVGQAAGIPVQLELMHFDVVGRDVNIPISLRIKEVEAANLLAAIAKQAGCVLKLGDDGIVRVLPSEAELATATAKAFDLTDFGGQLPVDVELFKHFIDADEETVIQLAKGQLVVQGNSNVAAKAALALEAFRIASGLGSRLDRNRCHRWIRTLTDGVSGNNAREADWLPIPEQQVGINEDREYGLEMVLGDVAADAGAALVLDWASCWTHGLTPEATALPWYAGKKTHEIFEQVLRPYALLAFDIGTNVYWVGSQEDYEKMSLWSVLEASSSNEQALQRIALAVGKPLEEIAVWKNAKTGKLVVYLPRFVIRQLPDVLRNP